MRRFIAAAVAVFALPLVAAVPVAASASRPSVVSALPPSVITDISYAPAEPASSRGHLLDLYLPPGGHAPRPLVIWTGGSAWMADNGKDSAAPIAEVFTAKGYAVAGVSVRSSFQATFPAQVYDIKAAIRWLRAHAGQYRLDPKRFAIMGDSSGGWTTAMAALTSGVSSLEGNVGVTGVSSQVQAAVAFYPPTEFLRMDEQMLPGACAFFNQILGLTDCHNDVLSPESRLVGCAIQTCPQVVGQASPLTDADLARSGRPVGAARTERVALRLDPCPLRHRGVLLGAERRSQLA
jgi:acetyl esterase/lipase